jgi:opacity protein-like surface antigen
MKTTKKLLVVLAFVLTAGMFSKANAQMMIGAGLNINLPMGDFGTAMGMGIGGGIDGRYMVTDNISVGLTIDYASYKGKDLLPGFELKSTIMPIMVRGDYYFGEEGTGFYAGLGLGFASIKTTATISFFGITTEVEAKSSGFAYALRAGYIIPAGEKLGIDLNASYNSASQTGGSANWIGIHAGILFKIGG